MHLRQILATSVTALALVSTTAVYAAPTSISSPVHAVFTNGKMVKISFRNDSGAPLELKVGDNIMKVQTGATLSLKLPAGSKVITNTATPKLTAGSVVTEVAAYLDGATLAIH
jgi:hypothetical protein